MSPLAFHKYQNTASRQDPTPSTKFGAATGEGTNTTTLKASPRDHNSDQVFMKTIHSGERESSPV